MESRRRRILTLGFVVIISFPLTNPAVGATTTTTQHDSLEKLLDMSLEELVEVRVAVASYFVESQLDAGATVAVVTEQQWKKRGARQLMDAIGHLPGTLVLPNWFSAQQVMIRGYANGNNSGGIATLWDDVPVSSVEGSPQFNRQFINLGTLDRIEIIRGPGSALHGENAFHGVLSMRAFESATDISRVNLDIASNEYGHAAVKHSQSVGGGRRLHVSGGYSGQLDQHQSYNYYEPPGSSERAYEYQSRTAVAKLTSDPERDLTWKAGVYYDDINSDGFLSGGTSGSSGLDGRDVGGVDSDILIGKGELGYKINATTRASASIYYWTYNRTYTRTTSLTRDLTGTGGADEAGFKAVLKQTNLFGNTQWSLAFDARLQRMTGAHRKIVDMNTGVIADEDLQFKDFARDIYSGSLDANTSLFGDSIHVRYGARVDQYSDFGTQITPRFGIIHHAAPNSAFKLLYGKGFRAPNSLEVKGSATIEGNANIKSEEINTYEVAYVFTTPNTLSEVVVFRSDWHHAIMTTSTTTPGFTQRYVNSGESHAQGAEYSFAYQGNPWTVETSGSYVRSENVDLNENYVAFPAWMLNGGVGYDFAHLDVEVFLNAQVLLQMDEGQITESYPNPQALKKYLRGDLNVKKQLSKHLVLTLDIRNLANRDNRLPSIQSNPSPGGIPEEERSAKLGITYQI